MMKKLIQKHHILEEHDTHALEKNANVLSAINDKLEEDQLKN